MNKKKIKILFLYFFSLFFIVMKILPANAENGEGLEIGTLEGLSGFQPEAEKEPHAAGQMLTKIFSNTFGVLTIVGGLIFILYFTLAGLSWITSSGKPDKVQKAQEQMINALIGLIVVVASFSIAYIVGEVLGIKILDPAYYLEKFLGPANASPNPSSSLKNKLK